jgi:hypothetical protein
MELNAEKDDAATGAPSYDSVSEKAFSTIHPSEDEEVVLADRPATDNTSGPRNPTTSDAVAIPATEPASPTPGNDEYRDADLPKWRYVILGIGYVETGILRFCVLLT